jgi:hypothetical protein
MSGCTIRSKRARTMRARFASLKVNGCADPDIAAENALEIRRSATARRIGVGSACIQNIVDVAPNRELAVYVI